MRPGERPAPGGGRRRYAILAEGAFHRAKTGHGLLRYGEDEVVCVIDSRLAGRGAAEVIPDLRRDAPIVGSMREALDYAPTSVLVGVAPAGGRLPAEWMEDLRLGAGAGLEIVAGLHERLAPRFPGRDVWDVREPPAEVPLFSGEGLGVAPRVVLTVGTSSAIGKMTATLELRRAAEGRGLSAAFAATGQTGIVVNGWGISVDAVVSDFVAGAAESLVLAAAEDDPDLVLVEGQGAIGHPAYSGVTVGLLHGSCADCLVLCCDASEEWIMGVAPRPSPARAVRLYEEVAALVKPAPVVAVSVNTRGLGEGAARAFVERVAAETGLPAADPVRDPADPILDAVLNAPGGAVTGRDAPSL